MSTATRVPVLLGVIVMGVVFFTAAIWLVVKSVLWVMALTPSPGGRLLGLVLIGLGVAGLGYGALWARRRK